MEESHLCQIIAKDGALLYLLPAYYNIYGPLIQVLTPIQKYV
jgi:hypothetical protein